MIHGRGNGQVALTALLAVLLTVMPTRADEAAAPAAAPAKTSSQDAESRDAKAAQQVSTHSGEQPDEEIVEAIRIFRTETERQGARGDRSKAAVHANSFWNHHGRVYEYFRNDALDAVPHEVRQRGGDRNPLRRNQFGVSVSGPLRVPKLYDGRGKTFFTFSYEGTRERVGRSYLRTLPTTPQRSGEFSDLVNKAGDPLTAYDPASTSANPNFDPSRNVSLGNLEYRRDPFPNNRIPESRFDRVARNILPFYPLPNTSVGPFLQNNYWANPSERNAPNGVLAKLDHNLLGRHKITVDLAYSKGFRGSPPIYDTIADPARPDRNYLDRRLRVSDVVALSPSTIYSGSFTVDSRVVETDGLSGERDIPAELGFEGVGGQVFPALRFGTYYGMGASSGSYLRNAWNSYRTDHSVQLSRGRHSLSVSSSLRFYELNTFELDLPSGELRFDAPLTGLPGITNTGDSFASFLLGLSNRAETTDQLQPSYLRRSSFDNRIRDEIQIAPNLTATFGFGVDVSTPRVEKYDRQSTIDLAAINPENGLPGALVFASHGDRGRAFQPVRVRFEPNAGFSWSPTASRNMVVRGTFWRYYGGIGLRTGPFGTQGYSGRRKPISPNEQLAPAVVLADGFPAAERQLPNLSPVAANGSNADLTLATSKQPTYNYFRLELERSLPLGFRVRAAGRSYRGKNMLANSEVAGVNNIPTSSLVHRDQLNNEEFRAALRPYPQFQQLRVGNQAPIGKYLYDVGAFSVEKRTGQGLSLDLSYQVLRRWDNYSGPGVQDTADREFAWARTRNTRPHRLSLSYMYELPFGRGKPLLNGAPWADKVLGGWSVSGFTTWLSGDPVALEPLYNNTGGVAPHLRVNSVDGVDPTVGNQGPELWFNPGAFVDPADFTLGDVPRTHPTLRNPGFNNHDIAIAKRLPISQEQSVELMLQGFNFMNHGNWNDPDVEIGPADARNANAGRIIGSRGGRVLQLGLRYNF